MTREAIRLHLVQQHLDRVRLTLGQLAPPTQNALQQWARAVLIVRDNPSATWNAAVSELVRAAESELAVLGEELGLEELAKPHALGQRAHAMKKLRQKGMPATATRTDLTFVLDELPELLLKLAEVRKHSSAVHGSKRVWNATAQDEEAARRLVLEGILPGIVRSRSGMKPIRRVLLVCAGNTCRSPMGGGLLRHAASVRAVPLEVRTAGVCVTTGSSVNPLAVSVLRSSGIDISGDHPEQLRKDLVEWAGVVVPLSRSVHDEIVEVFPAAELKIMPDVSEIPDPFGGVLADYETCRDRLLPLVDRILNETLAGG
jgi:protein-tyrosine phosphatase